MEGSEGKEQERILIPVANPETIEGLVGMALMMRHPKQKESLVALSRSMIIILQKPRN